MGAYVFKVLFNFALKNSFLFYRGFAKIRIQSHGFCACQWLEDHQSIKTLAYLVTKLVLHIQFQRNAFW